MNSQKLKLTIASLHVNSLTHAEFDRKQTTPPLRRMLFAILESIRGFWPSIGSKCAVETKRGNLVAWGGIEPPTQGFSTLTLNLRVQYFQRVVT